MIKPTVSVGIPAYTEEQNIVKLLKSILAQKQKIYKLKEIIVVVDGKEDNTSTLVKSMNNPLIRLIEHSKRLGQQAAQNEILQIYKGDVIVIIEADTVPHNKHTINNLVKQFVDSRIKNLGMVVGSIKLVLPRNFFEKILYHGFHIKFSSFNTWKKGVNIYTCNGQAMKALSKDFAKKIRYPVNVPEDAYTYLSAKKYGFQIQVSKDAVVLMKNVSNLGDRMKQCMKFQSGRKILKKHFKQDFIAKEYAIPLNLMFRSIILYFLKHPLWTVFAICEMFLNRIITIKTKKYTYSHGIYYSSKNPSFK